MAEDNLGTSDLLEFAIYLPALSLDFVYFLDALASLDLKLSVSEWVSD